MWAPKGKVIAGLFITELRNVSNWSVVKQMARVHGVHLEIVWYFPWKLVFVTTVFTATKVLLIFSNVCCFYHLINISQTQLFNITGKGKFAKTDIFNIFTVLLNNGES